MALLLWAFKRTESSPISKRPSYSSMWLIIIVWAVYRLLHVFMNEDVIADLFKARELWLILMLPLVLFNIKTRMQTLLVLYTILLASFIPSISAFINFASVNYDLKNIGMRSPSFDSLHHLTFAGNNALLFVSAIVIGAWSYRANHRLLFVLSLLSLLVNIIGIVSSRSLGTLIALTLVLLIILVIRFKWQSIPVITSAILLMVLATPSNLLEKDWLQSAPDTVRSEKYCGSFEERLTMWWTGFRLLKNNPILGTGESDYPKEYQNFKHPKACAVAFDGSHMHNDTLDIAVNFGLLGLMLWLMMITRPIFDFFTKKESLNSLSSFKVFIPACLLFLGLSQCHFSDDEVQMTFWLLLGLGHVNVLEIFKSKS